MKTNTKKAIAMALIGVAGLGIGAGAGALMFPREIPVLDNQAKQNAFNAGVESVEPIIETEYITEEVIVEKLVNNTIEVEVPFEDLDFKKMACDRLMFDDMSECVKEVTAEDKALKLALEFIESEFESDIADEMEDNGIVADEDDVSLISIYDDFEDIEIIDSDFDDNEYLFKIKVKYDNDGDKEYAFLTISVEDGEVELEDIE